MCNTLTKLRSDEPKKRRRLPTATRLAPAPRGGDWLFSA
jgi:hypothetical protein